MILEMEASIRLEFEEIQEKVAETALLVFLDFLAVLVKGEKSVTMDRQVGLELMVNLVRKDYLATI